MSIRAGFVLPSWKNRHAATEKFGDPRWCLLYIFRGRKDGATCFALGALRVQRDHLEKWAALDQRVDIRVVGWLRVMPGVSPALADATLGRVRVFGAARATPGVRRVMADRGRVGASSAN